MIRINNIDELFDIVSYKTFNLILKELGLTYKNQESWDEIGFDDLDWIEMIMGLEKEYDLDIPDTVGEALLEMLPNKVMGLLLQKERNYKLDKLDINNI